MSMHKGLIGKAKGGGSVGFDRIPAVHMPVNVPQSDVRQTQQSDKTLSDYIQRKTRQEAFSAVAAERKLTFEEFIATRPWILEICGNEQFETADFVDALKDFWNAAQENK